MNRVVNYCGAELKIELYKCGNGYREFDIHLLSGDCPSLRDLTILCDGGDPDRADEEQLCCVEGEVLEVREADQFISLRIQNG